MSPPKFELFAENMLPDILLDNGVLPTILLLRDGKAVDVLPVDDFNEKQEYYKTMLPATLEEQNAEAYVVISEITKKYPSGNVEEAVVFHYQPREGTGQTRTYTTVRDKQDNLVRIIFYDVGGHELLSGPLTEFFHEPEVS